MSLRDWMALFRVIHIYSAIVLTGAIVFNTIILMPALRRIPAAHSAVVGGKIGAGLMLLGGTAIALLGISGFALMGLDGTLSKLVTVEFLVGSYGRWIGLMVLAWLVFVVTSTVSGIWYRTILTRKLPYSAGLNELEQRRAMQARISKWQDRLAYINLTLGVLAVLGGALATS